MVDSPSSEGAASSDADAAMQTSAGDGSATPSPSHVVEGPVQVQRNDDASNGTNSDKVHIIVDALAERLMLVLTGSSSFPAASGQLSIDSDFNLGLLKAVEDGVEQVWRTRKADLPVERGLKHKCFAWMAADLLGDPFPPSEIAEKLGKSMQTRAAGLRREEKAERDRSSGERRAAANAAADEGVERKLDGTYRAITSRLNSRLEALLSQPYPAYAKACRPTPLDTTSQHRDPLAEVAATAEPKNAAKADNVEAEAEACAEAEVCADRQADSGRPRRVLTGLRSMVEFDAGWAEAEEHYEARLQSKDRLYTDMKAKYDRMMALQDEEHEEEIKKVQRRAEIDGAQRILWELQTEIRDVAAKVGRQVEGAFAPLSAWVDARLETVTEQEQEEYADTINGRKGSLDAYAARVTAIWSEGLV